MRSLTLLLIPLILLSSCTIDWSDEKDKKNDTFLKNIECSKYKNEIETKIDKDNKDWGFFTIFDKLSYSKKLNTCLLKTTEVSHESGKIDIYLSSEVEDYLGNKTVLYILYCSKKTVDPEVKKLCSKEVNDFNTKFQELESE